MIDENLKETWKRAGATTISREGIEQLLRPAAGRTGHALVFLAWSHVAMLGVAAALAVVNLAGYRGNPIMLAVEAALALTCGACTMLGVRLVVGLRTITRADLPLAETIERRLAFYERWFEPWLLVGAASPWLLTLAVTTLIDNENGTYRINHPGEFAIVTALMLGGTYAVLHFSMIPTVSAMRAVLHDLRAGVLDATVPLEAMHRRSRVWVAVGVVLLALAVLFGVVMWLKAI